MKDASLQIVQDRIEELRGSTDFVATLLESPIGYAIIAADFDGNVIAYNEGAHQIYGYAPEEVMGKQDIEILFPEEFIEAGKLQEIIEYLINKGRFSYEGEKVRKDGERFPAQILFTLTKDKNGKVIGFIEIVTDLTERRRAEKALQDSEANFRKIITKNADSMLIMNQYGIVRFVNPATESLFARKAEGLLGKQFGFPIVVGETTEIDIIGKSQRIATAEMRVVETEWEGESAYLLSLRDITERKKMEQQLNIADRLMSVGEMASGIAHEINNPLTAVIGFTYLLGNRKDLPEDVMEQLKIIQDGGERVAGIVKRLLTFARQRKPERSHIDINEIIGNTLALRSYEMATSNIEVVLDLDPELPWTMADTGQLQQVFLNIMVNAEQEMSKANGRGRLEVKTELIDNGIRVSFRDDGTGISKKNMEKLFDPFFTTKEVGAGTGLGLSLSHGIIAEHGGRIYAESEPGQGATFFVELPVLADESIEEKASNDGGPEDAEAVIGSILVVDDEEAIRKYLATELSESGHRVEVEGDAKKALEKLSEGSYDVIMTDIKMPGMDGMEFYRRVRKMDNSMASRIVFITGDMMGGETPDFIKKTGLQYVTKPFNQGRLQKVIKQMLVRSGT